MNTHLSAANGLMEYMGRRDLQLVGALEADKGLQPELSRVEYLRLLRLPGYWKRSGLTCW